MMSEPWMEFGTGMLAGGLGLSACWGLFWFVIGTTGYLRGTCSHRALLNGLGAAAIPILMMAALAWLRGDTHTFGPAFVGGLSVMPLVLTGFGLRRAPDGRPAVVHMLGGVRHLMGKLLGTHQACGGCEGGHGGRGGGCG